MLDGRLLHFSGPAKPNASARQSLAKKEEALTAAALRLAQDERAQASTAPKATKKKPATPSGPLEPGRVAKTTKTKAKKAAVSLSHAEMESMTPMQQLATLIERTKEQAEEEAKKKDGTDQGLNLLA